MAVLLTLKKSRKTSSHFATVQLHAHTTRQEKKIKNRAKHVHHHCIIKCHMSSFLPPLGSIDVDDTEPSSLLLRCTRVIKSTADVPDICCVLDEVSMLAPGLMILLTLLRADRGEAVANERGEAVKAKERGDARGEEESAIAGAVALSIWAARRFPARIRSLSSSRRDLVVRGVAGADAEAGDAVVEDGAEAAVAVDDELATPLGPKTRS